MRTKYFALLTLGTATLGWAAAPLQAQDTGAVAQVIEAFHAALAAGDSTTALSMLSDDVVILESGGTEDKDHYRNGHVSGDMRFAQAVPRERGDIDVRIVGDVAWASSTSLTQGRMGDREINSQGAELVVLVRDGGSWKISAIHWSSRSRRE
jgi:ketosteroid isomerase-like protein